MDGALARRVRFENLAPIGTGSHAGISEVVFREAALTRVCHLKPEDGTTSVALSKTMLEWSVLPDASDYSIYMGTSRDALRRVALTDQVRFELAALEPDKTYYWRVDAVPARGRVVPGRVPRFQTAGLVAWWQFDETGDKQTSEATGYKHIAELKGPVAGHRTKAS